MLSFETFSMGKRFKILIPFFFFGILYTLFCHLDLLGFMADEAKYGYWFLWAIVIYSLFLYIIRTLKVNLVLGIVAIEAMLLMLHFFFHRTTIGMTISTDHLWYLWPFFTLGLLMKRGAFDWFKQRAQITFLLSVCVISFALFVAVRFNLFHRYWPYNIVKITMAFPICISLLLVFYDAECRLKGWTSPVKSCLKSMGTVIGTSTLQIYVLHYFILHVLDLSSFGQYMIDNNMAWLELIVSPVLAILISYVCVYAAKVIYKMHLGIVFGR